jgi:hypothetical protein
MKLVAKYDKYELIKNANGTYFHCYYGERFIYGYERNETEAIKRFAKRLGVSVEDLTIF